MTIAEDDAKTRSVLLTAALDHIPFDGWSKLAMDRANDALKLPDGTVHRLFPRGVRELLTYSSSQAGRLGRNGPQHSKDPRTHCPGRQTTHPG